MALDLEKTTIPLKTVLQIIGGIVSLVGIYYALSGDIKELDRRTDILEKKADKYSPEAMSTEIQNLKEQVRQSNEKADKIISLLK